MQDTLEINLASLPEFGDQISGEIKPEIYELKEQEGKATTGLVYDLHIQQFETELLLRGSISTVFELQCVRTLHPFTKTIALDNIALSIEITEEAVNPTEQLREEIMILLPVNPVCEMGDEKMSCEIEEKYLALDKDQTDDLEEQPADKQDNRWSALDQLDNL